MPENDHRHRYADAIRQARHEGLDAFHSWFNTARDVHESTVRGHWDFALYILTPKVCEYIVRPEEKTALEIGYGGGRLLNAACCCFREVVGIDIHDEQATVERFLQDQHKTNFRLLPTDGASIDVPAETIDFVYSFIVLQHLPSFDALVKYLEETQRCLRPGGVAQLYFGRYSAMHPLHRLRYFARGFREIPDAQVNYVSLMVRVATMKRLCRRLGFQVVDVGTSYKRILDQRAKARGGQSYVTAVKRQ